MARGARGVTCRDCGCLNFSTEHDVCGKCRCKKRRLSDSTSASNKRHEPARSTSSSKKRPPPDIIDLVSSDEEEDDVEVQNALQDSLKTHQQETKTQEDEEQEQEEKVDNLFQSRGFPSVNYKDSDFPSPETATSMRKHAAVAGGVQTSRKITLTNAKSAPAAASQPAQENKRDPKPVESKPLPPVVEEKQQDKEAPDAGAKTKSIAAQSEVKSVKQPSTSGKAGAESDKAPAQPEATSALPTSISGSATGVVTGPAAAQPEVKSVLPTSSTGAAGAAESGSAPHPSEVKDVRTVSTAGSVHGDEEKGVTPQQAREFESIAFKSSDFVTVFDGLAVARRSHPPPAAAATSTPAVQATPTSSVRSIAIEAVGSTTVPTAQQPPRAMIPTTTLTAAAVDSTSKTTSVTASAAVPTATSTTKASSSTSKATATTTAALSSTAGTKVVVASAAVPTSTKTVSRSTTSASSFGTKVVAASAAVRTATSTTKPSNLTSKATAATTAASSSTSAMKVVQPSAPTATSTTTASSFFPPQVTAATIAAFASTSRATTVAASATTPPSSMPKATTAASTATVAAATGSVVQTMSTTASRSGATQEQPSSTGATASSDGDGVAFVKTIAAPREIVAVEPPALGFCSSAFMEFMRECGETDGEDENDPEALSSSQLRLLDVIDLTNLSDSEESDAESPLATPRAGELKGSEKEEKAPANGQPGANAQASVLAPAQVSGTGTWFVPTLDSDRRRTQPEKVMCELCEEKGSPYRLIHCPTCTKYYHKKCAKENGDENVCWNCELGSMIDDSELDQEHAKHTSEYLAYLKAIRHGSSSADEGGEDEPDGEEGDQIEGQEAGDGAGDGDGDMTSTAEGGEDKNPFTEGSSAGARWKEFIGDATADIDASFHEVTNRIAEELRDEEKRRQYSRGFVSREEYEEQMAEVEEYYISEEARLQQLERDKALEAKKAAEAKKAQEAAAQTTAPSGEQPSSGENRTAAGPPAPVQGGVNTVVAAASTVQVATPINSAAPAPATLQPIAPAPAPVAALRAALSYLPAPTAAYFASMRSTFMRAAPEAPPPPSNP